MLPLGRGLEDGGATRVVQEGARELERALHVEAEDVAAVFLEGLVREGLPASQAGPGR